MAPFHNYTTKAKEAIHRAHQLAVERGHNQVSTLHLFAALLTQEESMVLPMLEQLDIDVAHLTDSVLELIEGSSGNTAVSPSFQLYLTPELVRRAALPGTWRHRASFLCPRNSRAGWSPSLLIPLFCSHCTPNPLARPSTTACRGTTHSRLHVLSFRT